MTGLAPQFEEIEPATRLGRYELTYRLGAGTYAIVFAAYDNALDRHVALKVFRNPDATAAIEREARALARINHPNVVALHEVGEADGLVFLVMDVVHGGTMRDYIRGWHDWREVVWLFIQAARGLAAVHEAGFAHGDVTPANILIGDDGRVQITDLGLARMSIGGDSDGGGTVAYLAPERLAGDPASAAADQFSLCVALWEALYRERPWSTNDAAVVSEAPTRARLRADVPRALVRVILRGLAAESRHRFEHMNAFTDALTRALVDARRQEDRRWALVLGTAAALVILALAVLSTWWT
jgi:serine/threonine protein kinase